MNRETGNLIADLVLYGRNELGLGTEDAVYASNQLLELLEAEPADRAGKVAPLNETLNGLISHALEKEIIDEGDELRFETKLMGLVTPSAGLVVRNYFDELRKGGAKSATDYLYRISVNNKYIRMEDISRNIRWYADGPKGTIGITINLSKPEKDNKQVAAERNAAQVKYPKCMLCLENIGFCGTATHPARQTLRIVPLELDGEDWHMQYSPYMYYDEHIIVFSDEHRPMAVTGGTFRRLLDFVDMYPHYFLGSNADLPIVGGSILSHDHYQGGKKVLPMFLAKDREVCYEKDGVKVTLKDWYNSVVSVSGTDKKAVAARCEKILAVWRNYSDESVGVLSHTGDVPHNTVTPIATKTGEVYRIDMILRNNRTDEAHPDGIFHPTADMHNIKKEGIGIIEAMGLFILPGRLKKEIFAAIKLLGQEKIDFASLNDDPVLAKHLGMIASIAASGLSLTAEDAQKKIIDYVNATCLKILDCTAVFKSDEKGRAAFAKFVNAISD